MATLDELCDQGALVKLGGGLDAHELPERRLYAFPHVVEWIEDVLPTIEPGMGDDSQSPIEQLDDLFYLFVSGNDLSFWEKSHAMFPDESGIWELKTIDLRLFGWFRRRNAFVVTRIDSAYWCKLHNLYPGYRGDALRLMAGLALTEPKFVTGAYANVL